MQRGDVLNTSFNKVGDAICFCLFTNCCNKTKSECYIPNLLVWGKSLLAGCRLGTRYGTGSKESDLGGDNWWNNRGLPCIVKLFNYVFPTP